MPESMHPSHRALTDAEREQFVRDGFVRIDHAFASDITAQALARIPGTSAVVLEALATIDGTPVKTSAGKVRNIPPPATELISPAPSAAMMSNR